MELKNKTQREIDLEINKMNLESKEEYLRRLIETLVTYGFKEISTQAIGFEELFEEQTKRNYDLLESSKLSKEQKDDLRELIMPIFPTKEEIDKKKKSGLNDEEWIIKEDIEFLDKKIKIALNILDSLQEDTKKNIIEECIIKRHFWNNSFSANFKIQDTIKKQEELEKTKIKSKKGVKK